MLADHSALSLVSDRHPPQSSLPALQCFPVPQSLDMPEILVVDGVRYELSDLILQCIPFFLLAILIEVAYDLVAKKGLYRINDSISSLSAGILQQVSQKTIFAGLGIVPYCYVFQRFCIYPLDENAWSTWILCFLLADFGYWMFHAAGHGALFGRYGGKLGWAMHVTHHNSEEYNLTTALRQSATQVALSFWFYLPLALFFPPAVFSWNSSFNTVYQFWLHTRIIGRLGFLEYIFNTPSAHRLHHSRSREYLDCNFGGTLIVFDRIFGTFQEETAVETAYSTTRPLATWDPIWAQLDYFGYIASTMREAEGFLNKVLVAIMPPAWLPAHMPTKPLPPFVTRQEAEKTRYDRRISPLWDLYLLGQFLVVLFCTLLFLHAEAPRPGGSAGMQALFIVFQLWCFGYLFDCRPGSFVLEVLRLALLYVVAPALFGLAPVAAHALRWAAGLFATFVFWRRRDLQSGPRDLSKSAESSEGAASAKQKAQ